MTALDDWKAMRKTLATTIRSYRNACITLSAVSWLPIHRTSEHTMLEDMFLAIDSELDSLAAEESTLYDTRMALATVRNKSTTLARVNSLPFEILARIFSFSKINCSHKEKEGNGLHNFTGVCTYWRQITINSADLWTHVDITPNTSTGWMNLLLERTKGIPMHLHFYEQRLGASKQPIPKRERLASIDMLRLHIHRVQDLELYSYRDSISEHAITVLSLWLTGGSPNLARSLSVFRPHARGFLDYGGRSEESKIINQSDNAKEMLRCLSVVRLQHTRFDWDSGIYCGLVELQLGSLITSMTMPISQLALILASNPTLHTLKLSNLRVTARPDWRPPPPIPLHNLQSLSLFYMSYDDLNLALPLIGLPNPSSELKIGLTCSNPMRDIIKDFLAGSNGTSLYCLDQNSNKPLAWLPAIGSMPCLRNLVFSGFAFDAYTQTNKAPAYSSPPIVTLQHCNVTLEGLRIFIANHDTQDLRLERCTAHGGLEHIVVSLLEAYPELRCIVSDTISTLHYAHCSPDV